MADKNTHCQYVKVVSEHNVSRDMKDLTENLDRLAEYSSKISRMIKEIQKSQYSDINIGFFGYGMSGMMGDISHTTGRIAELAMNIERDVSVLRTIKDIDESQHI